MKLTIDQIKELVNTESYSFLRENPHLGKNIVLLTLGGSYAYGMETETSDVDVRGCAVKSKREILTNENFEQVLNEATDTTIYSLDKVVSLMSNCNPNTIEMLGCKPEHYIYLSPIGKELLENRDMFISKRCIHSFGGYALAQLRRLENISNKYVSQVEREKHILDTIENASVDFKQAYLPMSEDAIKLYIDKSDSEDLESEIFMDVNLTHYPLRDYASMWNEMKAIVSSYNKIGKRNQKALEHNKIGKHMAHLVRLYLMCIDLLTEGEIITFREKEHDLLMSLRNGDFLDENQQPLPQFYKIVDQYEAKLTTLKETTKLPDNPDYSRISDFLESVNERVVLGEL